MYYEFKFPKWKIRNVIDWEFFDTRRTSSVLDFSVVENRKQRWKQIIKPIKCLIGIPFTLINYKPIYLACSPSGLTYSVSILCIYICLSVCLYRWVYEKLFINRFDSLSSFVELSLIFSNATSNVRQEFRMLAVSNKYSCVSVYTRSSSLSNVFIRMQTLHK